MDSDEPKVDAELFLPIGLERIQPTETYTGFKKYGKPRKRHENTPFSRAFSRFGTPILWSQRPTKTSPARARQGIIQS